MKIEIAGRLQPFSHKPGTCCLIPGTRWEFQAFPVRFLFTSPKGDVTAISLPLNGPVSGFTLRQDLERGFVDVFGRWQEGFFLWRIEAKEGSLWLQLERAPDAGCSILGKRIKRKESVRIASIEEAIPHSSLERLSLGCHKKQEWELIERRKDLIEIAPFWLRLAALTPMSQEKQEFTEDLSSVLGRLFQAHFRSMFLPTQTDNLHQGLPPLAMTSPLHIGARLIRDALFLEQNNGYALLPALPYLWHSGRYRHITTSSGDILDLEWSKKQLRRVVLRPAVTRSIILTLSHGLKSFRLRTSSKSRGSRQSASAPLALEAGVPLFLDRFEK